ncbi:hypothetical protein EX30DRAFT_115153 [Ascodesmis nigricans]|uniref:Uncharacterized protein n=1 Tax=Ascodesmis nigricans TaxID=341454 RepID=A0A4S2MQ32_9PEZI|nr:hypothetical protein EX30DRAFT_115153 [Ascodesmis nigricans]
MYFFHFFGRHFFNFLVFIVSPPTLSRASRTNHSSLPDLPFRILINILITNSGSITLIPINIVSASILPELILPARCKLDIEIVKVHSPLV